MPKNITKKNYYDAACVVIYYKNNKIDEALEIINSMMFEGYAIFEETSFLNYFKNLYNDIKDYINSHKGGNIFTYIRDRKDDFNMAGDGTPDEKEEQHKKEIEDLNAKHAKELEDNNVKHAEEIKNIAKKAAQDREEQQNLYNSLKDGIDNIKTQM